MRERSRPRLLPDSHPLKKKNSLAVAERGFELNEQRKACRALERMQAARPLAPPPYDFGERRVKASERALARDIELGIVGDTRGSYVHFGSRGDDE